MKASTLAIRTAGTLTLLVLLAPLLAALGMAFAPGTLLELPREGWSLRWFRLVLTDPRWLGSIANSMIVALVASLLATVSGTLLAYSVTRLEFPGRRVLTAAALLPLVLPPLALALGLLPLLYQLELADSRFGLALAHAVICMPLVLFLVRGALRAVDVDLEQAARGLGADRWKVFLHVTWPLIRRSVAAAALCSFLLSFNEFTLALFLTGPESETLPRVIWPELRYSLSPLVAAASALSIAATVLLLALALALRGWQALLFGESERSRAKRCKD
jgi:ABC-type spermidine/putrescine transport system permease subunit II